MLLFQLQFELFGCVKQVITPATLPATSCQLLLPVNLKFNESTNTISNAALSQNIFNIFNKFCQHLPRKLSVIKTQTIKWNSTPQWKQHRSSILHKLSKKLLHFINYWFSFLNTCVSVCVCEIQLDLKEFVFYTRHFFDKIVLLFVISKYIIMYFKLQ